jgi:hypothetical protein
MNNIKRRRRRRGGFTLTVESFSFCSKTSKNAWKSLSIENNKIKKHSRERKRGPTWYI